MEKSLEFGVALHILLIDFTQVFDSLDRDGLMGVLEDFGIPKKLIRLVHMTLNNISSRVLVGGRKSKAFNVTRGVREGDALSALLFNLAMHKAVGKINLKGNIIRKSRQARAYTDDIALVSTNETALGEMFEILDKEGCRIGLR